MVLTDELSLLPPDALEKDIEAQLSPKFLAVLGFSRAEIAPNFPVGNCCVDWGARHNATQDDLFSQTKTAPTLYMEVKRHSHDLTEGSPNYRDTVQQLTNYLSAPSSKTLQWGIIQNANHAQLFRKHGRVVHPVTPCIPFGTDGTAVVQRFKEVMAEPVRGLTIALYNNKGGVGKTTTTINLAAALYGLGKKVLVVELDPNQGDLGDSLGIEPIKDGMSGLFLGNHEDRDRIIKHYQYTHPTKKIQHGFDVIPSDPLLSEDEEGGLFKLAQNAAAHRLRQILEPLRQQYDYILIDAPPGLTFFPRQALCAADVVLMPAKHNNRNSLKNAGQTIAQTLPKVRGYMQKKLGVGGPVPLPILLNNAQSKIPKAQLKSMQDCIQAIIDEHGHPGMDLRPFFYPQKQNGKTSMIFVPAMSHIAQSDFTQVPGVFRHRAIKDQYENLAQEYFVA